jgi:hypothetical protein
MAEYIDRFDQLEDRTKDAEDQKRRIALLGT